MSEVNKQNIDLKYVNLLQKSSNKGYCPKTFVHLSWLDYRDVLLKILYLVVLGIIIPKIRWIGLLYCIAIIEILRFLKSVTDGRTDHLASNRLRIMSIKQFLCHNCYQCWQINLNFKKYEKTKFFTGPNVKLGRT